MALKKPSIDNYELQEYNFGKYNVKCFAEKEDEFGFPSKSTGTTVWPSALLLCKYLVSNDDLIRNKTIVELGCGTALPGLLAAQLASKVVLTDKSKRILAASTRSIASNSIPEGHTCFAQRLTFGNHQECIEIIEKMGQPPKIDLIIASDVLYAASAIEAFWTTVCQLCDAGAIRSIVDPDAPAAPAPPSSTSENSTSLVTYPQLIMSFVSRDEAQDEAMLYAAKSNRFDYEQIPFDSFIPNPADVPSSNFVRPETMRLYKFTRRPVTNAASSATLELQAQLAQRRIAHLCT